MVFIYLNMRNTNNIMRKKYQIKKWKDCTHDNSPSTVITSCLQANLAHHLRGRFQKSFEYELYLVDFYLRLRLSIGGRGENLGLLRRNGRVAIDQFGENAAQSLDTQRKRSDVQEQNVRHVTGQHAT